MDVDVVRGVSSAGCRHVSADAALDQQRSARVATPSLTPMRAHSVCSELLPFVLQYWWHYKYA